MPGSDLLAVRPAPCAPTWYPLSLRRPTRDERRRLFGVSFALGSVCSRCQAVTPSVFLCFANATFGALNAVFLEGTP